MTKQEKYLAIWKEVNDMPDNTNVKELIEYSAELAREINNASED